MIHDHYDSGCPLTAGNLEKGEKEELQFYGS